MVFVGTPCGKYKDKIRYFSSTGYKIFLTLSLYFLNINTCKEYRIQVILSKYEKQKLGTGYTYMMQDTQDKEIRNE